MGSLTSIFSKGKFCDYLPRATSTLDTGDYSERVAPLYHSCTLKPQWPPPPLLIRPRPNTLAWHPISLTIKLSCPLFSHSRPSSYPKLLPALWLCHDFPTLSKSRPLLFPHQKCPASPNRMTPIWSSKPVLNVSSLGNLLWFHFHLYASRSLCTSLSYKT